MSELRVASHELYVPVLATSYFGGRGSWPPSVAALRRAYDAARLEASPEPDVPEAAWEIYRDATFAVSEGNNLWIDLPGSGEVLAFTVHGPRCSDGVSGGLTMTVGHN